MSEINREDLSEDIKDKLDILRTIHDKAEYIEDNKYIVSSNGKYGVASSDDSVNLDTEYVNLYYTQYYIMALNNIKKNSKLVLFNNTEYRLYEQDGSYKDIFIEHSALDYRLIEVKLETGCFSIIDTKTGEILGVRKESDPYRYRPYNNWLILVFFDIKKQCYMAITQEFEAMSLEDALYKKYKTVELKQKNKRSKPFYIVSDGKNELKLNQFGQIY